jgi:DNA-3-methyladenine glycosylase II
MVYQVAELYLSQSCPIMADLIDRHGHCSIGEGEIDYFKTLATAIISQQLSAKASDTIKRRLLEIVPDFTPDGFLSVPLDELRSAGLSSAKARYITDLSQRITDNQLNFEVMANAPDNEVIQLLIQIPGIGRWTAEMFLIFGLRRPNILSVGDAGLQRAVKLLFGEFATLEAVSKPWQPYRSVASWYLWRHLD